MKNPAQMTSVTLCIGSNAPDAVARVGAALEWLSSVMLVSRHTGPYMTAPEGSDISGLPYCNALVDGLTVMTLEELTSAVKGYEARCGRLPEHKLSGKVTIDIDITVFGGSVVDPVNYNSGYYRIGLGMLHTVSDRSGD